MLKFSLILQFFMHFINSHSNVNNHFYKIADAKKLYLTISD